MIIHEVANVEEAVDQAYRLRDEGKYNWFRGQVIDHPPHSSLFRRQLVDNAEELQVAAFRFDLFTKWLLEIKELQHLLDPANVHQLEAIMQHYGIPTYYIDFTTDPGVAGFFAADTKTPPPADTRSCIYCLDTKDLVGSWDMIRKVESRDGAELKTVSVNVSNLWRLQAQKGVFLLCNYAFNMDYNIDKIVFPYTGYPSFPTKKIIYPEDKSSLEILLDQYFVKENNQLIFRQIKHNIYPIEWESFPNGVYAQAFSTDLQVHPSWMQEVDGWMKYTTEDYYLTTGIGQRLRLGNQQTAEGIRSKVSFGVRQLIRSNPEIRKKAIDWTFDEIPQNFNAARAASLIKKVWNGMRLLPYDADDIGEACGNTIYLSMKSEEEIPDREIQREIFSEFYGKGTRVGFSHPDGSGSYGFAGIKGLNDAKAIDLSAFITNKFKDIGGDFPKAFQLIYNPKITFDFTGFKKLFAREVIPSQVAWGEGLLIFNPHRLAVFGNP